MIISNKAKMYDSMLLCGKALLKALQFTENISSLAKNWSFWFWEIVFQFSSKNLSFWNLKNPENCHIKGPWKILEFLKGNIYETIVHFWFR